MSTATAATYEVDLDGFPVKTCPRCGGAKTINAYRRVFNGVCFGCDGSGLVSLNRRSAQLGAQYRKAVRSAAGCCLGTWVHIAVDGSRIYTNGVEVGDRVRAKAGQPWRTVTAVQVTRHVIGYCMVGAEESQRLVNLTLNVMVTFDDGETVSGYTISWEREPDLAALALLRERLSAEAIASLPRKYRQ